MRALLAALIVCLSVFAFSAPAHAWWTTDVGASSASVASHGGQRHAYRGRHGVRHYAHSYGGSCAQAAALGGPCGCIAMQHAGLSDRKFWAVRSWRAAFPQTSCHPGAAALWGNYHVEIVTGCDGNIVTTTSGRRTPIGRLAFVDPHGGQSTWASAEPPQHAAHVVTHHYHHYAHYHHYRHYAQRK